MEKFLQQELLSNTIGSYLWVMGSILLALFCKRLVSKYFASLLYRIVGKRTDSIRKKSFLELVVQPMDVFLVLLVSLIAVDKLRFPKALDFNIYHITFRQLLDTAANATLIIVFIWLLTRVIEFIAIVLEEKANRTADLSDNQLIVFFKDFFKVILVIIGILMIFRFALNKDVSNLLTSLSIVGAAIALATRESMENLIASFIIFFDKPFMMGDLVKGNTFSGHIEKIGLRSTRIRTLEKTFITVPNKQMVDTIIDNISLRTQRKADIKLELSLRATSSELFSFLESIRQMIHANKAIENSSVFLSDTGKNAHLISIDLFAGMQMSIDEFNQLREAINLSIIKKLEEAKMELAATNIDVVISEQ